MCLIDKQHRISKKLPQRTNQNYCKQEALSAGRLLSRDAQWIGPAKRIQKRNFPSWTKEYQPPIEDLHVGEQMT